MVVLLYLMCFQLENITSAFGNTIGKETSNPLFTYNAHADVVRYLTFPKSCLCTQRLKSWYWLIWTIPSVPRAKWEMLKATQPNSPNSAIFKRIMLVGFDLTTRNQSRWCSYRLSYRGRSAGWGPYHTYRIHIHEIHVHTCSTLALKGAKRKRRKTKPTEVQFRPFRIILWCCNADIISILVV